MHTPDEPRERDIVTTREAIERVGSSMLKMVLGIVLGVKVLSIC